MRGRWVVASLALALVGACDAQDLASNQGLAEDEQPAPWTAPGEVGPYSAGFEAFDFVDARGKELRMEVWYPAEVEPGTEPDSYEELAIAMDGFEKARPDLRGAPYPVVAFSHGFGAIRYQSAFLTEYLAQHGYVVVAPDHPGNTMLDLDEDLTGIVAMERPGDVMSAVDELLDLSQDHPRLAGMAQEGRYAVMGHSFGSITALAVGGGEFDIDGLVESCEAMDTRPCGFLDGIDPAELEVPEPGALADARVVATIPLSPGLWYAFHPDGSGLSSVVSPMVLGGDSDTLMDMETELLPTYAPMTGPKALGVLAEGGHYAFSDICDIAPFFDDCGGPEEGWIDMDRAHAITRHVVQAWLDGHLLERQDAGAYLEPEALSAFPELDWQAE